MHFLFDWGDTLMADIAGNAGPMCHWPAVKAMPNARATLDWLSRRAGCHIATNAKDSESSEIRRALARAGLDSAITHIFCFKTVGHEKPSREFFEFITRELQVDMRDLVMVGDDLNKDIAGALESGLQAIWYNPDGNSGPAEIVQIQDLGELITVAEHLLAADG